MGRRGVLCTQGHCHQEARRRGKSHRQAVQLRQLPGGLRGHHEEEKSRYGMPQML